MAEQGKTDEVRLNLDADADAAAVNAGMPDPVPEQPAPEQPVDAARDDAVADEIFSRDLEAELAALKRRYRKARVKDFLSAPIRDSWSSATDKSVSPGMRIGFTAMRLMLLGPILGGGGLVAINMLLNGNPLGAIVIAGAAHYAGIGYCKVMQMIEDPFAEKEGRSYPPLTMRPETLAMREDIAAFKASIEWRDTEIAAGRGPQPG